MKARLGLKKGAPEAGARGAVPAPGGARLTGAFVPPPPGAAPPQPAVPDARVDPFGAMNAMAAHGATQAAPQIVIVNDGKPVESVQKKGAAGYLKVVGIVAVPLVLGFIVGGISYKNEEYNKTIDDAKLLTEEVRTAGKGLQALYDQLLLAKERGADKQSYLVNDKDLTAGLESLALAPPDPQKIYHSNLFNMDAKTVEDTMTFFADVAALKKKVDDHVRLSKGDGKKIGPIEELKAIQGARFGAIFRMPKQGSNEPALVEIVELGAPVCADNQAHPEGCGSAKPIGFEYRPDPTIAAWGKKLWASDTIAVENIVPIGPTTLFDIFLRGSKPYYDEVSYMARIKEIDALTSELQERRKLLEDQMNKKAQEGKRFSL